MADMYLYNKEGSMISCMAKEFPVAVKSPMQPQIDKYKKGK